MPRRRRYGKNRPGTAVVELAICLPVIILLVFGSIQACNLIFLKQAVTEAAYQGMLVAMTPGADQTDVDGRISTVLTARSISGGEIDYGEDVFADLKHGEPINLGVTIPSAPNLIGPRMFTIQPFIRVQLRGDKQ